MRLKTLYIKGFRNFKEVTVNFNNQSLIIGANDVGKTNLLYALRILLDRGFSDYDLELKDSDFYAYKDTNEVVVGDKQDLFANVLYGNKVNCMSVPEFEDGMKLMAKIRYNSPEVPCRVYMTGEDKVSVVFDEPQRAITPGQAVVFYDGDIVVGGATILRAANENM